MFLSQVRQVPEPTRTFVQLDRHLQLARMEEATAASALAGFSAKLIRSPHHCVTA